MKLGKVKNIPEFNSYIRGNKLQKSTYEKNLGVDIMPKLSPGNHFRRDAKEADYILVSTQNCLKLHVQRNAVRVSVRIEINYEDRKGILELLHTGETSEVAMMMMLTKTSSLNSKELQNRRT